MQWKPDRLPRSFQAAVSTRLRVWVAGLRCPHIREAIAKPRNEKRSPYLCRAALCTTVGFHSPSLPPEPP